MSNEIKQGKLIILTDNAWLKSEKHMVHITSGHFTWLSFLGFGHEDEVLDEVIDHMVEHYPNGLYDAEVNEEFERLKAEGASDDEAWEGSAIDMICGGNCGNWLRAEEVHFTFNPSREEIKRYSGEEL